jgi:hypothetical protein
VQTTLTLPRRTIALTAAGTWCGALAAVVVISAAARVAVAWSHATPNYFPDEYISAAPGRGLGSVRGVWGHFPALLQRFVLTAPAAAKKTTMALRWHGHQTRRARAGSSEARRDPRHVSVRATVPTLDAQPWGTMSSKRAPVSRGW